MSTEVPNPPLWVGSPNPDQLVHELTEAQRQVESLERALRTSRTIGTAIGVLVERHKITPDAAFTMLVRHSQRTNRKLRDIADDLLFTGELP